MYTRQNLFRVFYMGEDVSHSLQLIYLMFSNELIDIVFRVDDLKWYGDCLPLYKGLGDLEQDLEIVNSQNKSLDFRYCKKFSVNHYDNSLTIYLLDVPYKELPPLSEGYRFG